MKNNFYQNTKDLLNGFSRFYTDKINRILILFIVIFVSTGSGYYYIAGYRTEKFLNEQMLHREQIIVRAGTKSIESFLELAGYSFVELAENSEVIQMQKGTQDVLENFISNWKDTPLVEVVLIDKEGVVQFVANDTETFLKSGISVIDRDYFIAASQAKSGEVFIGKPILPRLGAFEGRFILSMSTPVLENGELKGVLGCAILLSELTKTYLDPLRISEDTQIYLINEEGIFLHSFYPELIGKSAIEYFEENSYSGGDKIVAFIKEGLTTNEEGKFSFVMPNLYNKAEIKRNLLAYSALTVGDNHFILVVSTPVDDAMTFFGPFFRNQIMALVLILLSILSFSAFLIMAIRIDRKDAYLDGFTAGRNHRKEEKKESELRKES